MADLQPKLKKWNDITNGNYISARFKIQYVKLFAKWVSNDFPSFQNDAA